MYELGNEQDQQELVSTLVETLMTGKRYDELEYFRVGHRAGLAHTENNAMGEGKFNFSLSCLLSLFQIASQ